MDYLNGGLESRYKIEKTNGEPVDPNADYFVLRLDKDPNALVAIRRYAEMIRKQNKQLFDDIVNKYGRGGIFEVMFTASDNKKEYPHGYGISPIYVELDKDLYLGEDCEEVEKKLNEVLFPDGEFTVFGLKPISVKRFNF